MVRLLFDFALPPHRKRFVVLFSALLLCTGIVLLGKKYYLDSTSRQWNSNVSQIEQARIKYVQTSFKTYQDEINDVVRKISTDSAILLSLKNGKRSQQACFERLQQLSLNGCTIELFDTSKTLFAWNGNEGVKTDTAWLSPKTKTQGIQGPIYSFLVVVAPVHNNSLGVGYIAAKRLFDVKYPISNRFINENVFSASFTNRFGIDGKFDFEPQQIEKESKESVRIPLSGVNGKIIGYTILSPLSREEEQNSAIAVFEDIQNLLLLGLLLLVIVAIASLRRLQQRRVLSLVWVILSVWILRYSFLLFDFPATFIPSEIFEPSLFASVWGFGIAKSLGDMFISSLCLLTTIILIANALIRYYQSGQSMKKHTFVISSVLFALILPIVLRGFAAVIHSAVFDSTLNYNDRMYIVPPFNLAMMFLSLFMITLSLVIVVVGGIIFLGRAYSLAYRPDVTLLSSLALVIGILTGGSLLIGFIHPNPLFSQSERIAYIGGFAICAFIIGRNGAQQYLLSIRSAALIVLAGIIALIYPLDRKVHESDRSYAEFLASNIFRPSDSYLTIFTQQALRELSTGECVTELNDPTTQNVKRLAFKAWAQSALSREGYNCFVSFYDSNGIPVSQFYIGADWDVTETQRDSLAVAKTVSVEDRVVDSRIVRIYRGYMPIVDNAGALLGGVSAEISAGKQALLSGETPEFLRNYPEGELESRHRTLVYSEYSNGKLTYSSSPVFHPGIEIPKAILRQEDVEGFWNEHNVDTLEYESYFFQSEYQNTGSSWYSLSMRSMSFTWHLYQVMRIALFLFLCSLIVGIFVLSILHVRSKKISVSFRTKLIGAFFVVALIPTTILAYYNRQYAIDRSQQSVIEQLSNETTTIATALQRQWALNTPFDLQNFSDLDATHAANDFDIPFTLFNGAFESASSTPELFRAELFDRRMTSDAYLNTMIYQKSFYSNTQSIGTLNYIVGYHPLFDNAGQVFAVIAVPTLFRLRELDREIVRRNVYLFGAFLFAMLVALGIGLAFSHQISAPVRRLHQATKKIGSGNFDVQLASERNDELGELERAFSTMLSDLKRSEEEKMKAQRELAWKEMAKQVAHEIKNPLTPMKLSIQHLRQAYSDKIEDFDALLQQISHTLLEQVDTLSRIASEFAHFARMPERKLEQCELHLLLRDVIVLFREYSDVKFDLQFCPKSPIILVDKEELRRAFINLVRNSIQAMNERGHINIRTTLDNSTIYITITDSGAGIPPEIAARLFEPNFSTKTDGMGMGLSIVKKTIEALDGTISIESKANEGTTVTISLPTFAVTK